MFSQGDYNSKVHYLKISQHILLKKQSRLCHFCVYKLHSLITPFNSKSYSGSTWFPTCSALTISHDVFVLGPSMSKPGTQRFTSFSIALSIGTCHDNLFHSSLIQQNLIKETISNLKYCKYDNHSPLLVLTLLLTYSQMIRI